MLPLGFYDQPQLLLTLIYKDISYGGYRVTPVEHSALNII